LIDGVTVIERPAECRSSAQAAWWLADRFCGDEFIVFSDDCVAMPDTFTTLLADVEMLKQAVGEVGIVGCRSNYAAGAQNIRNPNGSKRLGLQWGSENELIETTFIAPFVAWLSKEHLKGFNAPDFEWYADNWHCEQLTARGFRHFVSRAYVHHIGMRSSLAQGKTMAEMNDAGRAGYEAVKQ
jgi:hypothetical protein